ncbi:MAG: tetratricopeptide repeat protein [Candidatus Omnitrophica bacterium]|nr:tetratricopeptide repeat protein [Candidatus Omnitrophota bacterium]
MRKPIILLLIIGFLFLSLAPLHANGQMSEYLCELGIKFYREGRFDEALDEFKKALIV